MWRGSRYEEEKEATTDFMDEIIEEIVKLKPEIPE